MAFGSYRPKTLKLALNGQNFAISWQKFAISGFSRHKEYDFFQRGPYEQLPYQKLGRFIAAFGSYRAKTLKTVNFAQKMAKFWPQMTKFWLSQNFPSIYTMIF